MDTWDRCERRFAFERDYEPLTISPLGLLYRALEGALPEPLAEEAAKSLALKIASKMELQVTALEPYAVTQHVAYLAGIIATFIRSKLGILMPAQPTSYFFPSNEGGKQEVAYEWHPGTFEDVAGLRHRFVLVDHWDDDRLSAEAHSWATIGELAATGRPLTLHAIVIGAHRGGRRHSPWAKGFLHPQSRMLRFAKRKAIDGKHAGLSGGWDVIWREKASQISTEKWLQIMGEDNVFQELVISRPIKLDVSDRRLLAAQKEIVQIRTAMESATVEAPMRRSSCDETGRGPCPFQVCCYAPIATSPADLPHLFRSRR